MCGAGLRTRRRICGTSATIQESEDTGVTDQPVLSEDNPDTPADPYPWLGSGLVIDSRVKTAKYIYEHEHCHERSCQGNICVNTYDFRPFI